MGTLGSKYILVHGPLGSGIYPEGHYEFQEFRIDFGESATIEATKKALRKLSNPS